MNTIFEQELYFNSSYANSFFPCPQKTSSDMKWVNPPNIYVVNYQKLTTNEYPGYWIGELLQRQQRPPLKAIFECFLAIFFYFCRFYIGVLTSTNSSVIRQKCKSQNGGFKKPKQANFPENEHFLSLIHTPQS